MLNKLKKSLKGEKNMLNFNDTFENTIGVEIELLAKFDRVPASTSEAQSTLLAFISNLGLPVTSTRTYTHQVTNGWKVVTDSSLDPSSVDRRNGFQGFEFVSPILTKETFSQVHTLLNALSESDSFKVNVNCAVHVHFGARDLELEVLKGAIKNYVKNETAIKLTLPSSRRDGGYNQSMVRGENVREVSAGVKSVFKKINRASNHESLANLFRNHFSDVSLSSYFRQGTIEFRAHGGSLNAEKVNNWVVFLSNLFQAKNKSGNKERAITSRFGTKWKSNSEFAFKKTFFYLLNRNHEAYAWFKKRAEEVN
tara:strand:- start:1868 stop:2797 length:930 start_codon:yes stop_codon:yes gene_type:complete